MTKEQVVTYKYTSEYLEYLKSKKDDIQKYFPWQRYGCGTGSPHIEFCLQELNLSTNQRILEALDSAIDEVEKLIEKI